MKTDKKPIGRPRKSALERFLSKIRKDKSGCWYWLGHLDKNGYGRFATDYINKKIIFTRAHRFSYAHYKSPVPNNLLVCHSCDNPTCVNPDHLWLGTSRDNTQDSMKKGRSRLGPKHSNSQKVNYEIANKVREEFAKGGLRHIDIAQKLGISRKSVQNVLYKKHWTYRYPQSLEEDK